MVPVPVRAMCENALKRTNEGTKILFYAKPPDCDY
jgi:hypothetical protein